MNTWSPDSRLCAPPTLQGFVPGSPTSSLSSQTSQETSSSQSSFASSATSPAVSSRSWEGEADSAKVLDGSCANVNAASLAHQRSQADYRKTCLKSIFQCEDSWPTDHLVEKTRLQSNGPINPRRTSFSAGRVMPSLVRQNDRREDFVEYLVDTATQMVAVIWPNSMIPATTGSQDGKHAVLPLRLFIKETLRRSRTSYSTLQVAMYYLILIKNKASLPRCKTSIEDNPSFRSMHCGRRMFLAALILASKYLQDRNYSARAWSKISGLKINEINSNEMSFLAAVEWKLHISEETFQRWTEIVTSHTNSMHNFGLRTGLCASASHSWTSLVKSLTPALDFTQMPWARAPASRRPVAAPNVRPVHPAQSYLASSPHLPIRPPLIKHDTQFRVPPTPLLNSRLTTPVSTPSSTMSNTPAQACWNISPSSRALHRSIIADPQMDNCSPPTNRLARAHTLAVAPTKIEPPKTIISNPMCYSPAMESRVTFVHTPTAGPSEKCMPDQGIVNLLEAAEHLRRSSGDIHLSEITPPESPFVRPTNPLPCHSFGSIRLPSPSTSDESLSSDDEASICFPATTTTTTIATSPPQSIPRRKRPYQVSIDISSPFVRLNTDLLQETNIDSAPSSDLEGLEVDDDDIPESFVLRTRCRAKGGKGMSKDARVGNGIDLSGSAAAAICNAKSRINARRAAHGRKRVCC